MDYRKSHTSNSKGEDYDKSFRNSDYRQFILRWEDLVLKNIISEFVVNKQNYLDFACGTGRITKLVEQSFNNAYGIDVSESMIKQATKKVKKAKIIKQDITISNPFESDQMDLITSFRFFLNAEKKLRSEVLDSLHSILNRDGYLVFNIHNNSTIISRSIDKLAIFKKKLDGKKFQPQNSMSISEVRCLLDKHNFEIVKTYHKALIPLKSEKSTFKISKYTKIENLFSGIDFAKHLSRNIIYVCRKKQKVNS